MLVSVESIEGGGSINGLSLSVCAFGLHSTRAINQPSKPIIVQPIFYRDREMM